jgi:phage terminase large subunit-like protein
VTAGYSAVTRGETVITFCEKFLRVPDGRLVGDPVKLLPWQREVVFAIYDSEPPARRVIITLGRKGGKTEFAAMLLLASLAGPVARPNAQILSAAQSRDQAAIVFGLAAKMVRFNVDLSRICHIRDTAKSITGFRTGVEYRALSAEAKTAYGTSPVFAIHDELGQVRGPRSELYDSLETGAGAHQNPLSIVISTQAPTDADLLSTLIDDAEISNDPTIKLFKWAADHDDDPWDEATWHKANPGLRYGLPNIEELRRNAEQAKRLPALEARFKNLHLNMRIAAENHFIGPEVWKLNAGAPDLSVFKDAPVFGGLDLSTRQDLTALVFVAKDSEGFVHVQPLFFIPEKGLRERADRDKAPYDLWVEEGLITATPGHSVDYSYVAAVLANFAARCDIREVRYDPNLFGFLEKELERKGVQIPLVSHPQNPRGMTDPLGELEALALNGRLRHGMHPILTLHARNSIIKQDSSGYRKIDKSHVTGRVDGMVALAMAVAALAAAAEPPRSKYQLLWV